MPVKLRTPASILFLLITVTTIAAAQSAHRERLQTPFQTLTLQEWVGRRLIFLPMSQELRVNGYQAFGVQEDEGAGQRQYDALVGKVGTVTSVTGDKYPQVTLRLSDGATVAGKIYAEMLDGVGPADDIDSARARYRGATLWTRSDPFVIANVKNDSSMTALEQETELKVIDVTAGAGSEQPVRFIVRTPGGSEGYVDVHMSNTNVAGDLQKSNGFHDTFLDVSPKTIRQWPAEIRKAIDDRRVLVGMSAAQVHMALGEPDGVYAVAGKPNRLLWVYAGGVSVQVEGEKVVALGE
ncbi:MAG TPA: hypothetical protein VHI13_08380 [Candidatus Kapabacteria bacterium]|nr:hypothetical protein [Candidatus Kapabacteria bacterium]